MANNKSTDTTDSPPDAGDPSNVSKPPEEELPPEVIVIGDEPPVDDKPPVGDEPPEDQENEGDIAAREALIKLREQLASFGFSSVFEVVRDGPSGFKARIQGLTGMTMTEEEANTFFNQAEARAAGLSRLYTQLCARSDPAVCSVAKLEAPVDDTLPVARSLGSGGSYEQWFKRTSPDGFSHPDSAGSLFSPASYLTDLYRAANPLHPSSNGLQLNQRRPDLGALVLSDANLNEEISTLELTLEVLKTGLTGNAEDLLREAVYPMNLPYNHVSEQILQGMEARKSSPAELWSVLGDFEGQALKQDTNLNSWATRMPAAYARDALGMSPQLFNILTEPENTSNESICRYFGISAFTSLEYSSHLQAALQLPVQTIISILGGGPFYELSSPAIVAVQSYGARYINSWDDGTANPDKPMYVYVGAGLGQPVPAPVNSPSDSAFHNRSKSGLERLNRLVRLQHHVKLLSFEELDWLICQANNDITAHPLTQVLQALAVYLPLRQRHNMTVDNFAACLGVLNTFHGAGKDSFYTSLFGADDLIGQTNVDFQQTTQNQGSLRIRAQLCQGLKIDDGTLIVLAQFLPGMNANRVLAMLGLEQISALYRMVAIPRLFGLSVAEALHFWDLFAAPDAIVRALAEPRPNQIALGVLIRTGYLVDWMRTAELEPGQLVALTSRRYPVQGTPELKVFIENIYSTLTGRAPVDAARQAGEITVLRALMARHIGAEFNLKANIAAAALLWVDAVAKDMAPTLEGYDLMSFWADIERICQGETTLDGQPRAVQYAYLMRQFAQVCHWAQLGEQDLGVLLPMSSAIPSALTGEQKSPPLTLALLLLLSRYGKWLRTQVADTAEARSYLQRAAALDSTLTLDVAAQQISDLHGWDVAQTLVLMKGSVPRSFAALLPLLQKMQLGQRLGLSPSDLSWVGKLTESATVDQATLTLIAAKVMAAAHG